MRGPIGEKVYGEFEEKTGIKLIMTGFLTARGRSGTVSGRCCSPDDVKGLKLRSWKPR